MERWTGEDRNDFQNERQNNLSEQGDILRPADCSGPVWGLCLFSKGQPTGNARFRPSSDQRGVGRALSFHFDAACDPRLAQSALCGGSAGRRNHRENDLFRQQGRKREDFAVAARERFGTGRAVRRWGRPVVSFGGLYWRISGSGIQGRGAGANCSGGVWEVCHYRNRVDRVWSVWTDCGPASPAAQTEARSSL